jgi:hypothetical protein
LSVFLRSGETLPFGACAQGRGVTVIASGADDRFAIV